MPKKKKRINRTHFERKIKIWTLLVPVIVALIGSATSIGLMLISNKSSNERVYKVTEDDLAKLSSTSISGVPEIANKLHKKDKQPVERDAFMRSKLKVFINNRDFRDQELRELEKKAIELKELAEEIERRISKLSAGNTGLKKKDTSQFNDMLIKYYNLAYDYKYGIRLPKNYSIPSSKFNLGVVPLFALGSFIIVFLATRYLAKYFLKNNYEIEKLQTLRTTQPKS
jgi:hypothetical protein